MSNTKDTQKARSLKVKPRRSVKATKVMKPKTATSARKVFGDPKLFGAVPGMAEWAIEELKGMRDKL